MNESEQRGWRIRWTTDGMWGRRGCGGRTGGRQARQMTLLQSYGRSSPAARNRSMPPSGGVIMETGEISSTIISTQVRTARGRHFFFQTHRKLLGFRPSPDCRGPRHAPAGFGPLPGREPLEKPSSPTSWSPHNGVLTRTASPGIRRSGNQKRKPREKGIRRNQAASTMGAGQRPQGRRNGHREMDVEIGRCYGNVEYLAAPPYHHPPFVRGLGKALSQVWHPGPCCTRHISVAVRRVVRVP